MSASFWATEISARTSLVIGRGRAGSSVARNRAVSIQSERVGAKDVRRPQPFEPHDLRQRLGRAGGPTEFREHHGRHGPMAEAMAQTGAILFVKEAIANDVGIEDEPSETQSVQSQCSGPNDMRRSSAAFMRFSGVVKGAPGRTSGNFFLSRGALLREIFLGAGGCRAGGPLRPECLLAGDAFMR